jgi:hypothetical protein
LQKKPAAAQESTDFALAPLLRDQIRIQQEAIALWKRWMFGLLAAGIAILAAAQLLKLGGPAVSEILKLGGAFVGVLGALPYKEIIPRKERLATYQFLLTRLGSPGLSPDARGMLLSLANDAFKETLKR